MLTLVDENDDVSITGSANHFFIGSKKSVNTATCLEKGSKKKFRETKEDLKVKGQTRGKRALDWRSGTK